jgi:hypothetical protein
LNRFFTDFEVYRSLESNIPENCISGENEKGLLIVIKEEENNSENIQLLTKILQAIDKSLKKDAHLLTIPNDRFFSLSEQIKGNYHHLISFGYGAKQLGFSFETKPYIPSNLLNISFLFAHPLSKISANQELKKKLWAALQNIFK